MSQDPWRCKKHQDCDECSQCQLQLCRVFVVWNGDMWFALTSEAEAIQYSDVNGGGQVMEWFYGGDDVTAFFVNAAQGEWDDDDPNVERKVIREGVLPFQH